MFCSEQNIISHTLYDKMTQQFHYFGTLTWLFIYNWNECFMVCEKQNTVICSKFPQISIKSNLGKSSKLVISPDSNNVPQTPANHFLPKTPAKPSTLDASEYNCMLSDAVQLSCRKICLPLKDSSNICHACKSTLAWLFKVTRWCLYWMPQVRLYNLLKKARPGTTTEHAKDSKPKSDCKTLSLMVRFLDVFP